MNILLTSVGRRSYLVKYFKNALEGHGEVHVSNSSPLTPAFAFADKSVVTPLIYDKEYIPFLLNYCKSHKINAIISLFDVDLPVLAENKMLFNNLGIQVVVSDKPVIDICNDKYKTYKFLLDNGFNSPKSYISIEDALSSLKNGEISYPLIIKPRWGMGSIAVFQADNEEELKVLYNKTLNNIKNTYLKYESEKNFAESVIVQEKLSGQEYGLDVINDLEKNYQNTIVKLKYAMRSGETDCAEIVNNIVLKELGESVSKKLGHIGNLDIDVFLTNGIPHIIDMNARFGGGYPFSHVAGIDLPKAIVNWLQGKKSSKSLFNERFGVLSHKDIDIVQINFNNLRETNQINDNQLIIRQLTTESEILDILCEFNNIFIPSISQKVSNIKDYAKKLSEKSFVYVAKLNKNLGFVSFYANDFDNKVAYISFIGVHPEARNNKIGKKLLDMCYKKSKEQGMRYIKLEVQNENFVAKEFYRKNGFVYLDEASSQSVYMIREI